MKIQTALILALSPLFVQAQSTAFGYDFGLKEGATIATTKVRDLTNVFGLGFNLDVDAFAGVSWTTKTPMTGFLVGTRRDIAKEVQAYIGAGASIAQGQNFSPVIVAGFSWKS